MAPQPVKTKKLNLKVTPEQHRALEQRATSTGLRLGTWIRLIVLQAASQKPRKGYLHIREPNGDTI